MSEVLSQSEVESLLAALDTGGGGGGGDVGGAAPTPRGATLDAQISVYDFKRPERVSKDQMRSIQALHEGFGREFGAALSGILRNIVECKLISVDQLTYSEFVFSLENPTCFNLLDSAGLEGSIILDVNPSIIFPIVDRLLGGGKAGGSSVPARPLTDIEVKLVTRITDIAIKGLETAWGNIVSLGLSVSRVESNPQLVQIVPPNEVVVLVSFEIAMGDARGIMNLCIPFNTIEPLSAKLTSDAWSKYTKRSATPEQKLSLEVGVSRAAVHLTAELARTTITTGELASLAVGDVLLTEHDSAAGLEIRIENRPMFSAQPGVYKGRKAIRITGKVQRPKDRVADQLREMGIDVDAPPEQRDGEREAPVAGDDTDELAEAG